MYMDGTYIPLAIIFAKKKSFYTKLIYLHLKCI